MCNNLSADDSLLPLPVLDVGVASVGGSGHIQSLDTNVCLSETGRNQSQGHRPLSQPSHEILLQACMLPECVEVCVCSLVRM